MITHRSRRILFVCMQMSPHSVRWINALSDRGWDLHMFPCNAMPTLPTLRGVTVHRPFARLYRGTLPWAAFARHSRTDIPSNEASVAASTYREEAMFPFSLPGRLEAAFGRVTVRLGESDASAPLLYGPQMLARLIAKLQPDLIHSMEFQHNGYRVTRAKEIYGAGFPPWLATNWGSDIYHFRHDPGHFADIKRLLAQIDFYSCECNRDVELARKLGMTAKVLPVMPNSGGFDIESAERERFRVSPSRRRVIMVKGYQHFAGRALTALAALEHCADVARHFDIVVFSPSPETIERARQLKSSGVLPSVTVLPYATHDEILRLHATARLYLGVSISDAISTSALEAMAMGAFPIQTNTSCCDEWFSDGHGGFLIPPDDIETIADRVRRALTDDVLVDRAAQINWKVVTDRLDISVMRKQIAAFYDEVFGKHPDGKWTS